MHTSRTRGSALVGGRGTSVHTNFLSPPVDTPRPPSCEKGRPWDEDARDSQSLDLEVWTVRIRGKGPKFRV